MVGAVSSANQNIRTSIRDETGLKFSEKGDRQGPTIAVVDGLPSPLAQLLEEFPDPVLWELILNGETLRSTQTGLQLLNSNFNLLTDFRKRNNIVLSHNEFQGTCGFVDALIRWLDSVAIKERFKKINHDVMGAYFFRKRRIEIYWLPISIVARLLEVSVEGLTIVVLAHELLHAYTHVGSDHAGEQWDTETFANSDDRIVEGLAQFYTRAISRKLEGRIPGVVNAFEKLLTIQSPAYTCFSEWTDQRERAGEIIRFSMIGCRNKKLTNYEDFLTEMEKVRERIGRKRPTS